MLTVACVLKSGGVYTPAWAHALKRGVAAHLPEPHRFICLTDMAVEGIDTVPFIRDLPGWWAKINLFAPGLFSGSGMGRVLYLDLDVVVTGYLGEIAHFGRFSAIRDWNIESLNSSVMSWDAETGLPVWDAFDASMLTDRRGDQWLITRAIPGAETYPEGWCVSYRKHCREGIPDGARVACFHGRPKMPDVEDAWVKSMWRL